jgi:methylenetetrahydrofolate--tRNA-(uracil-5-)-methyltransferase
LRDAKPGHFQPMNSNWGLVDPLDRRVKDKKEKRRILGERAQLDFLEWMRESGLDVADPAMVVTPSAD